MYRVEDVSFPSGDATLAGRLFLPPEDQQPVGAYAVIGPVSYVKEQSPTQYATRLAANGFAAVVFDPTGFGASTGTPRLFDNPQRKVADLRAAVDYLCQRPEIDPSAVAVLGICMGCNWAAQAAADDDRITHAALVVGAYSIRSRRVEAAGGQAEFDRQVAQYQQVVDAYERDGTLDHHTMVAERMQDSYFSWPVPFYWYRMWTDPGPLTYKGQWANQLATISDLDHYCFDVAQPIARITIPTVIVNSTNSATPHDHVKRLFELLPADHKHLVLTGEQIQVQFYDDPITIDQAVDALLTFRTALPASSRG